EMSVRLALGVSRDRLIKQLLTEGMILSVLAAAGGLVVAFLSRNFIMVLFPARLGVIVNLPAEIDWRVLALSATVCLVSTLLFGLAPAMQATRVDLAAAMKNEAGGVIGGSSKTRVRSALVMVQVSLSFVLLVGAGLLFKSLQRLRSLSPGFSTQGAIDLYSAGYDSQRIKSFQDQLIDRVQALPGVESAAFTRIAPFSYRSYSSDAIRVDGYVVPPGEEPTIEYDEVGPGYLATMGIPLVAGREFMRSDNEKAALVAVVNETMAAQYWRGEDPAGRRFQVNDRWMQVVGVAKDSKYQTLMETGKPFFYVAMRQNTLGQGLQIRTRLGPETMAAALAQQVRALDPNMAPYEVITMREQVDRMTWAHRAPLILLAIFGGLALVLAAIGLYGVMSYAVSQSSHELGLRMALGAGTSNMVGLVMSRGLRLTVGGVLVGAGAALMLTRLIGDLLYKVSPRDPAAFGLALAVMLISALAACFFPAWRAARTDPVRALKD
ncbi:MAG: FtsX-like permease family protein, partial [Blastocatellia bacterium]